MRFARFVAACIAAFLVTLALFVLASEKAKGKSEPIAWCEVSEGMRPRFDGVTYDYDQISAFLPCKMLPLKRRA